MENPIIDNRIVSDHTFAVRLLGHLYFEYPEVGSAHPIVEEDYEYLVRTVCKMVIYQFETCPDSEKWYFDNLVKGCQSGKELIEKFYGKDNPDFIRYLKVIKAI